MTSHGSDVKSLIMHTAKTRTYSVKLSLFHNTFRLPLMLLSKVTKLASLL